MTKKAICAECKFHIFEYDSHKCDFSTKIDYVTGETICRKVDCYKKNLDGNCQTFQQKQIPDYVPKFSTMIPKLLR